MSTTLLILLSLALPAVWGCLAEALLRRLWRRRESSQSLKPDDRDPAVDFQI